MESVPRAQIPDGAICFSLRASVLGKGTNPFVLSLAISKIIRQTGFFNLNKITIRSEGKLWIQTSCTLLKNWPCVASCLWRRGWVNTYLIRAGKIAEWFYRSLAKSGSTVKKSEAKRNWEWVFRTVMWPFYKAPCKNENHLRKISLIVSLHL